MAAMQAPRAAQAELANTHSCPLAQSRAEAHPAGPASTPASTVGHAPRDDTRTPALAAPHSLP